MPTSITFNYRYDVSSYLGGVVTLNGTGSASTNTLNDSFDGTADGTTAVEDSLLWNGIPATYVGLAGGGVVIQVLASKYLVTNDTSLSGTTPLDSTTPFIYCYLAGTAIRTPGGERAVETLAIGDLVTTHDGRQVPVRWIGRQVRDAARAWLNGALPVRVRAGALGTDAAGAPVPTRDLCVSPDHALLVDGLLVHALALVNGMSITRVGGDELAEVAYYHIETADHELIVADGAPAETFIDNASRAQFDNHAEWLALHPHEPVMQELPLGRVKLARQLPRRIADRLAVIAAGLPAEAATRVA